MLESSRALVLKYRISIDESLHCLFRLKIKVTQNILSYFVIQYTTLPLAEHNVAKNFLVEIKIISAILCPKKVEKI